MKKPAVAKAMAGGVGATGFEPTTSTSRTWRATGLRYAPRVVKLSILRTFERGKNKKCRKNPAFLGHFRVVFYFISNCATSWAFSFIFRKAVASCPASSFTAISPAALYITLEYTGIG